MAEEWVGRQPRTTVVLLLIALGLLGAWLGVRAQERRTDWPTSAPPASAVIQAAVAQPPDAPVGDERTQPAVVSATQVKMDSASLPPPATLPASVVATGATEPLAAETKLSAKLPAEIPTQPHKMQAKVTPTLPPPEAPPSPGPVKFPELPEAPPIPPPVPATPSVPLEIEPPKQVTIPGPPAKGPTEQLHLPRLKVAAPVVAPPPLLPEFPKVETPLEKKVAPLAESNGAKPMATTIKQEPPLTPMPAPVEVTEPKKLPAATPIQIPEVAPPSGLTPLPNIEPKQSAPALPAPMTPAPVEVKKSQATSRPPAFLLVKPRRVETPPQVTPPPLAEASRAVQTPLTSPAAQVTVEKHGPSVLRQGASAAYQIIVRNRGVAPSGPVTVVDEIPRLGRLLGGNPEPIQHGDKAIWTLPPLPSNSETILKLELEATDSGDFVGNTTVFVSAAHAVTRAKIERDPRATTVSAGPLGILVRGPAGGAVGQPVVFEVQVTNRGKQWLSELMLHGKLSEGLTHPSGNNIEADIDDLAPGATKTFKMPTTAVRSGRQSVEARITAAGGVEAKGQAFVFITVSGLSIQTPPTNRLLLDRDGDIRIEVTNLRSEGLRNVVIADTLPENLQFVAASDRGIYQAATRTVQWLIDDLPAGATRGVTLRLHGNTPGQFAKEVLARAESQPELRAQSLVVVEGYTDLVLKVTPRDQPLEYGKETVCEVRVQNLGSSTATGVQLQLALPPGLTPGFVQGPTAHRMQGRTLVFEPIAQLSSRMQAVYHIGMTARAAGDLRLRAQAVSEQGRSPVTRDVSVFVYHD